jgi:hypothetical protein
MRALGNRNPPCGLTCERAETFNKSDEKQA